MKKLLVSASILAALGLAGCGGETIDDIQADAVQQTPVSRIVFDPANGNLNIPNDLLMLPSDGAVFDYTINIPVADPSDFSDPQNALNVLDGWSSTHPFQLNITVPAGESIDASTLSAGIRLFEATLGLNRGDADCAAIAIPSAGCKMGRELTFGVDFVMSLGDIDTINIVPLIPFAASQGHMLVVTDALKDSSGKGVKGSTTWDLVKQDIQTNPLATASQLQLQTLVNTYITAVSSVGYEREEVSYVQAFTTQSIPDVLSTIKQLQVAEFAQRFAASDPAAGAALPAIIVSGMSEDLNAMEKLGLVSDELINTSIAGAVAITPALQPLQPVIDDLADFGSLTSCSGLFAAASGQFTTATMQNFGSEAVNAGIDGLAQAVSQGVLAQVGPFCAATLFEANISLPYYSGVPSADNPLAPVNEFWDAACDSGIVIASAPEAFAAATSGPNDALCTAVGLRDVRLNGVKIDAERRLTKFSPVPQNKGRNEGNETLDVQMTIPNPAYATALGITIEMPEGGWPVVMLVHGITSQKEAMLAISGTLSLAGFATVSIDQPIHGSRGFDLTGNGVDDINATTISATNYLNLASLPTARDNSRQAVSDLLGVRLGLNAVVDASNSGMVDVNSTDVSLMGVSLGGITGGMFASIANTPFEGALAPLSGLYTIQAVSLESPGGGLANFLLESPSFGPLVKGSLLSQSSPDFQGFMAATYGTSPTEADLLEGTVTFLNALSVEQLAEVNAIFGQFAFAAQTVTGSSDPINFFTTLSDNTPVHMLTVVGDGTQTNLPDQVIPVSTSLPLSGQLALARIMGLEDVVSTIQSENAVSGIVKFNSGAHGSSLSPASSGVVTVEMQTQIATYLATKGRTVQITNTAVIAN
jgi:Pla-1/cef family extracellular lipase